MKQTPNPSQNYLPIAGIQDNVLIMNDGGIRVVLKISPINFELKSEDEQNAIIYGYQEFLNSLSFPIQIIVQSKKLDLQGYLGRMEKFKKNLNNELLKIQIEDYIGFVDNLISIANIMSKQFYVVVNYSPISAKNLTSPITRIMHQQVTAPLIEEDQFERYKSEIFSRSNLVASGLSRLGLKVTMVETQKLIELFYSIFNPDVATEEKLTNVSDIISNSISRQDTKSQDQAIGSNRTEQIFIDSTKSAPTNQPPFDDLNDSPATFNTENTLPTDSVNQKTENTNEQSQPKGNEQNL